MLTGKMLSLKERKWLIKYLANDIRAMEEDVELSGRYDDLEMAREIVEKLKQ